MKRELIVKEGSFIEGSLITVCIKDTLYKRIVRYNKRFGLYIIINNRVYFEYDFDYE